MIKHLIASFFLSLAISKVAESQTTIDFVFTDASGFSDTLKLGIDSTATDSLDDKLGEVNIKDSAMDSFEVRFIGLRRDLSRDLWILNWASKKQFINPNCSREEAYYTIGIHSKSWPISVSWDSSKFTGDCPLGGGITGFVSDYLSQSNLEPTQFKTTSSVTFTPHGYNEFYYRIVDDKTEGRDTIQIFYMTLSTERLMNFGLGIQSKNRHIHSKKLERRFDFWLFDDHDLNGRRTRIRTH